VTNKNLLGSASGFKEGRGRGIIQSRHKKSNTTTLKEKIHKEKKRVDGKELKKGAWSGGEDWGVSQKKLRNPHEGFKEGKEDSSSLWAAGK